MALRSGLHRALQRSARRSFSAAPHAADQFVVDFPEQREGLDIEFNWSLADDDVTPHGDAFRNLPAAKLAALAAAEDQGKKKGKAAAAAPARLQVADVDVSIGAFEAAFERVTAHLSAQPSLFAQDGAVGSFQGARSRVRVLADAPRAALFAQSLLVRVPTKDPHAARPIVAYVASTGAFADAPPAALMLVDADDAGTPCAKVVLTGAGALAALPEAVGRAKQQLAALEAAPAPSLVLPADALAKDGKTALVFGASPAARATAMGSGLLYAAHMAIWGPAGLSAVFGGAAQDAAAAVRVAGHNLVAAPSAAIFVDPKAGAGVSPLSPADAAKRLAQADAAVDADQFAQLLADAQTKSFVVRSDADIASAFAQV